MLRAILTYGIAAGILSVGVVISLISALLLRNSRFLPARAPMGA